VISPLLANIYLHYAFDLWANRWRQGEATGDMIIVRYADDIVAGPRVRPSAGPRTCFLHEARACPCEGGGPSVPRHDACEA
jgi:hypothetical protein